MSKSLVLIAKEPNTAKILKQQLNHVLGDKVDVQTYYIEELPNIPRLTADLFVVSTKSILNQAKSFIPPNEPILISRRTINHNQISKVLKVPTGSKVIVVIDYIIDSQEFCSLLENSGINHIELFPWEPGMKVPKGVEYAFSLGKQYLVPNSIKNVIDVGIRLCDITTVAEIMWNLGLLDEQANMVSAKYNNTLIKLYEHILHRSNETDVVKVLLEAIIQNSNDGILFINENNEVSVFNQKAEEITGVKRVNIIDKEIIDILPAVAKLLTTKSYSSEEVIKLGLKNIVVTLTKTKLANNRDGWIAHLKDVTEILNMENELRRKIKTSGHLAKYTFDAIVGDSKKIEKTISLSKKLALAEGAILLTGESGVGKELFAQAIHNYSRRKNGPFVAANFSAFTDSLVESELFGYEEGAFTGARKGGKPGLFEMANGGTIFLDEIGDANLNIQSRLLRILQEKEIMRVGDTKVRAIDVRIIAATNKNFQQLVREGKFRDDLYYRLSTLPLKIPPLRERIEDVDAIIKDFVREVNETRSHPIFITPVVMESFFQYDWPGNIRELRNVIEYLNATVDDNNVYLKDLPEMMTMNQNISLEIDDKIEKTAKELTDNPKWPEYLLILQELSRVYRIGKGIGRRKIAEKLLNKHIPLTEQEVRSRLSDLEEFGCVQVRKGASGTKITPLGNEVFELCKDLK